MAECGSYSLSKILIEVDYAENLQLYHRLGNNHKVFL